VVVTSPTEVPDLVQRALRSSLAVGYVHTTRNETGRLLATLAASRTGTLGELGTGSGAAAAWLRTGAPEHAHIVTVERDEALAELARAALADADVEVLMGGCRDLAARGPFSLLYLDQQTAAGVDREALCAAMEPGGLVIIDDFPGGLDGLGMDALSDLTRREWLQDERFESVDVAVAPDAQVLIATRR